MLVVSILLKKEVLLILKKVKKKTFSSNDSVIIDRETYYILLDYLDLYTKEIQNQIIYNNFFKDLENYVYNYKELEKELKEKDSRIENLENENFRLKNMIIYLKSKSQQIIKLFSKNRRNPIYQEISKDFYDKDIITEKEYNSIRKGHL